MNTVQPKVGVGLLILRDGKVLLSKRKSKLGKGLYGSTGGHLENGESIEDAVRRELVEEAGTDIKIKNLKFLCLTNFRDHLPKHYVDIGFVAEWDSGEPIIMEPDTKEPWEWHDIENLPSPIFEIIPNYIKAMKTGKVFFDN